MNKFMLLLSIVTFIIGFLTSRYNLDYKVIILYKKARCYIGWHKKKDYYYRAEVTCNVAIRTCNCHWCLALIERKMQFYKDVMEPKGKNWVDVDDNAINKRRARIQKEFRDYQDAQNALLQKNNSISGTYIGQRIKSFLMGSERNL